jgi:uncharacterized membrane protein YhaH (DUF805 family)
MTDTTSGIPLSQPLYGATIGQAISRFFRKYAVFTGRASRSEFWWWALVWAIVSGVLSAIPYTLNTPMFITDNGVPTPVFSAALIPYWIWWLATVVPFFALAWRRLHDTNRAGPFALLWLVPFVGPIIVIILCALPTDPAGARFDR